MTATRTTTETATATATTLKANLLQGIGDMQKATFEPLV